MESPLWSTRVWNAVPRYISKMISRMISVCFQGKPFNIMVIQVYALTSKAEEAEFELFYEGHKDLFFFFSFNFISWRLINLQYCSGFCHTLTWISHGFTCIPHPNPLPTSLPIPSLWVFPVHKPWALVSCIQPGLVVCFTLDSILVSMLFSQNIPPSPSPT